MDEASGIRDQASGDEAETQNAKCKMQNEGTDAESVGAVIGRPPEDEASGMVEKAKKRIAGLEGLRRWMLILAPLLLIGGYAADILPILYAAAVPLTIALLVTCRIKHLEEKQASENKQQTRS